MMKQESNLSWLLSETMGELQRLKDLPASTDKVSTAYMLKKLTSEILRAQRILPVLDLLQTLPRDQLCYPCLKKQWITNSSGFTTSPPLTRCSHLSSARPQVAGRPK